MSVSQEEFKEMLKKKGLKVTNQRLLVLEVLAENRDRHMTAEDIYELVKEDYPENILRRLPLNPSQEYKIPR